MKNVIESLTISTSGSISTNTVEAVDSCFRGLELSEGTTPSWLLVSYSASHDADTVAERLAELHPGGCVAGGSSCQGVMTHEGYQSADGHGMGMFAIRDFAGGFGVGAAEMGDDPRGAATEALERALDDAGRAGESPALVWINAAPGNEEVLLEGIADLVGPHVPVTGGSTGDNDVSGRWSQIAGRNVYRNAVVISVLFPSVEIAYAFHSGYDPTDRRGIVTRSEGRLLLEIDGKPAATVYNEWTSGLIENKLKGGGNVLADTTLAPLGREVGSVGGIPYFKLSHPDTVTPEGGLSLFSEISEGEVVRLMTGSLNSLITRAGRVTRSAIGSAELEQPNIRGALVIYCAGCMLTVRDDMPDVVGEIGTALDGAPFLGMFTFGEQGCFVGRENSHGNLMISVVVFSDRPTF